MDYLTAKLPALITAANNIAAETKSTFGRLTPAQLNWKPSADRWSVAQCFDHLLTSNKGYFPTIEGVIAGVKPTFWQRMPVLRSRRQTADQITRSEIDSQDQSATKVPTGAE